MILLPQVRHLTAHPGSSAPAEAASEPQITVDPTLPPQGYRLVISPHKVQIVASDEAGVFYGRMTLRQMLRQAPTELPCCEIEDWPDFPVRGVMLDISRDKVPTMESLFRLVDELAALKINHLELYTEHTFAYHKHEDVWRDASPMTAAEIKQLDAYCQERFIELVPNQNSFGHMERWLKHPRYLDLAECPEGFDWPAGGRSGPFSLNPLDPRDIELVEELYDELLPNFKSRKFNVGCDETFDLGLGRSKSECERRGKGRVYLDFLLKIHSLVKSRGHTMHFWGDIILHYPELIGELPPDVVALEWGYEADHPFEDHCAQFAKARVPFYVCPGTSSWNSLTGRSDNCIANLRAAAESGLKHGAVGYLNTDWGDYGHWQYLPVSYIPFAAGAALSWCLESNSDTDWIACANTHVFQDSANVIAGLAFDLGNIYERVGHLIPNASAVFRLLHSPASDEVFGRVSDLDLEATCDYVRAVMDRLPSARMERWDAAIIADELRNSAAMVLNGCERALLLRRGKTTSSKLAQAMREIIAAHRHLWLMRNRPGGLADSTRVLEQRLREYCGQN